MPPLTQQPKKRATILWIFHLGLRLGGRLVLLVVLLAGLVALLFHGGGGRRGGRAAGAGHHIRDHHHTVSATQLVEIILELPCADIGLWNKGEIKLNSVCFFRRLVNFSMTMFARSYLYFLNLDLRLIRLRLLVESLPRSLGIILT